MDAQEKLAALRVDIDAVDRELVALFDRRMRLSVYVARAKAEGGIALVNRERERQVIDAAAERSSSDNRTETAAFMRSLIELSKYRQTRDLAETGGIGFPQSVQRKTENITVAYQGVEGAWGEQATMRLFDDATLTKCDYFEDVFTAVKTGLADYGVLPIENSQTGAIGEVYDLLMKHGCYIVGEHWLTIAQCLLAPHGVAVEDIRQVVSHQEGLNQCRKYLKNRGWELTAVRNTAVAAQMVAETLDGHCAAIGSRRASEVHGLNVLAPDIMDSDGNRTRFIAISAAPVYDDASEAVSVTFSTAHESGALCAVLQSFVLGDISLTRLESRPLSRDRYRFFADLQANVLSDKTMNALAHAAAQCEYFEVLGCY